MIGGTLQPKATGKHSCCLRRSAWEKCLLLHFLGDHKIHHSDFKNKQKRGYSSMKDCIMSLITHQEAWQILCNMQCWPDYFLTHRRLEVAGSGTSLVVPWLRIHLSMQSTWVWPLVWDLRSHMLRITKPGNCNYRVSEPQLESLWATVQIPLANTLKGIKRERKVERKKERNERKKEGRKEGRDRLEGATKAERRRNKWIQESLRKGIWGR